MVAASPLPCNPRVQHINLPIINLSWNRDRVSELILKASEEFGFFSVINHGVPAKVISRMELRAAEFFALPAAEKQKSGPPNPLGYGRRNIGFSGDTGELEYLILHTNSASISQRSRTICKKDPSEFSCVVNEYVEAMTDLSCRILDILGEALGLADRRAFSNLIRDDESDSLIRLNHYPACCSTRDESSCSSSTGKDGRCGRLGFGEHSDPQLLSVLSSNDVDGLQIYTDSTDGGCGVWVPVPANPAAFCVSVGDLLQALTNGRLLSVRHRAMANSCRERLSMIYFAGPPPHALITSQLETVTPRAPRRYRPFTWADYKEAMYSFRLGYNRLDLFRADEEVEGNDMVKQFGGQRI